jgi:hypothetical protein
VNRKMAGWMITGILGLLLSGCVTSERTVYRDGKRTKVKFENRTAARLFYEALSKTSDRHHAENRTAGELPFVSWDDTRVVWGRNTDFNEAVESCDFNHDGEITELEARIFDLILSGALLIEGLDASAVR